MEPPYRGYGDYSSEEQEEHRHSRFPPPPPPGEDGFGERRGFDERREEIDGFPGRYGRHEEERYGREGDEEGYGRRRGERFGRGDDDAEGYPPEGGRAHFPPMGSHRPSHPEAPPYEDTYGSHRPSHPEAPPYEDTYGSHRHPEAPPYEDTYAPPDDTAYPQHAAPSHSLSHSSYSHCPSDEYVSAAPLPAEEELPAADASLTGQLDSLSLDLPQGRLIRIFCKENSGFNLAVERNSLGMQASNTEDESQQWIKDASHGMRIKDSSGYPAFSLVNKKTKKVLKHAKEKGQQVLLVDYQANMKDDDILWTESQDFGEGFKTIRAASDTLLNLTVFEGHKKIRNGSALVLDTWHKGDHQLWKLFPL